MALFGLVLLIDDDDMVNTINEMILKHFDLCDEIIIKEDIDNALDFINNNEKLPDVIFVDVNMPDKDGWDFVAEYEKMFDKNEIPQNIVMLSSSINPNDEKRAANLESVARFVSKPLTEEIVKSLQQDYFS